MLYMTLTFLMGPQSKHCSAQRVSEQCCSAWNSPVFPNVTTQIVSMDSESDFQACEYSCYKSVWLCYAFLRNYLSLSLYVC